MFDSRHLLLCVWLAVCSAASQAQPPLIYAPLPLESPSRTAAMNTGLVSLLAALTGRRIELRLFDDYPELLDAFATGQIHLTELGPLPYLSLTERMPQARALAIVRERDGSAEYQCVIAAPVDGTTSLLQLNHPLRRGMVALTSKLSTCGPLVTYHMLERAGVEVKGLKGCYLGHHEAVAIALLRAQYPLGGLKDSVARRFAPVGLNILAYSDPVPGFALVANPSGFSDGELDRLAAHLVGLGPAELNKLENGRQGFAPVAPSSYDRLRQMMASQPSPDCLEAPLP